MKTESGISDLHKLADGSMAGFPKDTCWNAVALIRALVAERDALAANARRYEWLKEHVEHCGVDREVKWETDTGSVIYTSACDAMNLTRFVDAAIDSAMQGEK